MLKSTHLQIVVTNKLHLLFTNCHFKISFACHLQIGTLQYLEIFTSQSQIHNTITGIAELFCGYPQNYNSVAIPKTMIQQSQEF